MEQQQPYLGFRCSEAEKGIIRDMAASLGLTISEYLRFSARDYAISRGREIIKKNPSPENIATVKRIIDFHGMLKKLTEDEILEKTRESLKLKAYIDGLSSGIKGAKA